MIEKRLYKPVAEFVRKEFNCFTVSTTTGTMYGNIDVLGLRHVMGSFGGTTEVIAVEVKPENSTFLKSLGQAHAYSIMADRCYLAIHKPYGRKISQEIIDMAAQLKVGLIEIGKQKSCKVLVSSPLQEPILHHKLSLVAKMGYVQCILCGSTFKDESVKSQGERSTIGKAIEEEKAFRYWLFDLAKQRGSDNKKYIYDRRHVCADCVQAFRGVGSSN